MRNVYKCSPCTNGTTMFPLVLHDFDCAHSTPEKFQCNKGCTVVLNSVADLQRHCHQAHAEAITPKSQFQCKKCPFKSHSKLLFEIHQCIINAAKYYCKQCSYYSYHKESFKRHSVIKHAALFIWLRCEHCEFRCKYNGSLKRHLQTKHAAPEDIRWFECEHCDYRVKYKQVLKEHVLLKHTSLEDLRWLQCEHCEYRVKLKHRLVRHIKDKHTPLGLQCEHCERQFRYNCRLKKHVQTNHGSLKDGLKHRAKTRRATGVPLMLTSIPLDGFNCANIIPKKPTRHRQTSTSRPQFQCKKCLFDSHSKLVFEQHQCSKYKFYKLPLKRHTGAKKIYQFQCEHCEYQCQYNCRLKRHVQAVHAPPKVERQNCLTQHVHRRHTSLKDIIRWFECEHCEYRSNDRRNLKRHVQTKHAAPSDIRWFACEHCEHRTKWKHCLMQHMKIKHTR